MKLNKDYILREFEDEIKRISNLRKIIENSNYKGVEVTPHNTKLNNDKSSTDLMIRNYLLHILQFGNPQERLRILEGINTRFMLYGGRLIIDK